MHVLLAAIAMPVVACMWAIGVNRVLADAGSDSSEISDKAIMSRRAFLTFGQED